MCLELTGRGVSPAVTIEGRRMAEISVPIVKHLPLLRRYARALVGSQDGGDSYVRICLEALLAEPDRILPDGDVRLQLYALFHDVWSIVRTEDPEADRILPTSPLEDVVDVERGLAALPPRQRQVLLLVSLEGFTFDEVSHILKISESEVRDYLDEARRELQRQTAVRVLIIEDEPLIAMDIARLVSEMGHRVCGSASGKDEAIRLARETQPQLVLADVQLKGGDSGIQAVQEILRSVDVPVIFVTGYPERLLTGEQLEPAFVLSKPFKPEVLKTAIGQALSVHPPRALN